MRKSNKRSNILDAALAIVDENGARHLTIDAVAAKSGVSKGGVLYHFATKQALLSGMLQHLVELSQNRITESQATYPEINHLMAVLRAREDMTATELRASQALIAAAAENTKLLAPAREQYSAIFNEAIADCDDSLAATVLLLASEGLRFLDILNVNPLDKKRTREVVSYMHENAEGL